MSLTPKARRALQCLVDHGGDMSAGGFYVAMGYGKPGLGARMKGPGGSSVLKGLAKRGWVHVYDDWFGGTYVTMGEITQAGRDALRSAEGQSQTGSERENDAEKEDLGEKRPGG